MTLREPESASIAESSSQDDAERAFVGSLAGAAVGSCYRIHTDRIRPSRGTAGICQIPRQNVLLAALPSNDYARVSAVLEPVVFRRGSTVCRAGDRERYLYFPTAGIVSRYYLMQDGATTEVAVTGSEGVIGVASYLGDDGLHGEVVALSDVCAYRLRSELIELEFERYRELPRLLLRYTQVLLAQMAQIAACTRHHSLDQQLCRWILSSADRLHSSELRVTQELIARMLGVRREGVTRAALALRSAGLIDYRRGRIVVLDRGRLEAHACECYGLIEGAYERLRRTMTDAHVQ